MTCSPVGAETGRDVAAVQAGEHPESPDAEAHQEIGHVGPAEVGDREGGEKGRGRPGRDDEHLRGALCRHLRCDNSREQPVRYADAGTAGAGQPGGGERFDDPGSQRRLPPEVAHRPLAREGAHPWPDGVDPGAEGFDHREDALEGTLRAASLVLLLEGGAGDDDEPFRLLPGPVHGAPPLDAPARRRHRRSDCRQKARAPSRSR